MSGFTIVDALGSGGMAEVYRARSITGDHYALKILPQQVASDRVALKRFQREGRVLMAVRHENVVRVEQFGSSAGTPFLVMELISGRSLTDRLRVEQRLVPEKAARIALQITAGIGALHAAGIIHRDLKPSNIMLIERPSGEIAKIVDLGLARMTARSGRDSTGLTRMGTFVGTPSFMAPEQLTGQKVGTSADLFGLGAIIHAMLTGAPPWRLTGVELVAARFRGDKPAPLEAAYGLETLVEQLMDRDPSVRPQRTEVTATLERVIAAIEASPSRAPKESTAEAVDAILDPPSRVDSPEALPLDPVGFENTVDGAAVRSEGALAPFESRVEQAPKSSVLGPLMARLRSKRQ